MLIEISYGEGLDRLTILEIKQQEIEDKEKLKNILIEINSLSQLHPIKIKFSYYYNLLFLVNKKIWDLTNKIKQMNYKDNGFAEISSQIFELNQSRFRLKNIINKLSDNDVKEQKSYSKSEINIIIDEKDMTNLDIILTNLSLQYDFVNIYTNCIAQEIIKKQMPEFNYTFLSDNGNCEKIKNIRINNIYENTI